MHALVTGSTGLLGSHIVEQLLAAGATVRALVRPSSDTSWLATQSVEIVRGEWDAPGVLVAAVAGVDVVLHVAAYLNLGSTFGIPEDETPYQRVNVGFTTALLQAAAEAGVRRFVYCSSGSVYGTKHPSPIHEDTPLTPVTAYGRSKVAAEAAVGAAHDAGLDTVIIRPPLIYGPRDRYVVPALKSLANLPVFLMPENGRYRLDLVYAGDLARQFVVATTHPNAAGRIYNGGSGNAPTLAEIVDAVSALTRRPPPVVAVPVGLIRRTTRVTGWFLHTFAPGLDILVSEAGLAYMADDVYYAMDRARDELGFVPQVGIREGVRLSFAALGNPHNSS